ncbi:MAG: DUF4190 domain-containing protein [Bifidobacteriaceae bacterium]|jgi:hypothetical protein|nr:DUF4190 domain-containing protein [Bifidobacteriaceae bacterium]
MPQQHDPYSSDPYPYPYAYPAAPPEIPLVAAPQNGMGVAALVLGIIGVLGVGICAVLAIIFGGLGMRKANKGLASNRNQSQAGMIMGIIGVGFWVFILWIFFITMEGPL